MPSPLDDDVTVVVIEIESGQVYVKLVGPLPEPARAESLLRWAVDHWLGSHPQLVIDRTEVVAEDGVLRGVHAWYRPADRPTGLVAPLTSAPPAQLVIGWCQDALGPLPKEYVEAVVDEAVTSWLANRDRPGTVLFLHHRRIVVVLDGLANRGTVLPLRSVEPAMDAPMKAGLAAWLASPQTRFLEMHLPRSWFLPCAFDASGRRLAEPAIMKTNMTYDRGRRP